LVMKLECPSCGMLCESHMQSCPKCDSTLRANYINRLIIADVAHSGEDWEAAREKILRAIDRALVENCKGVKVVHGRGNRKGHSSVIKHNAKLFLAEVANKHQAKLVRDNHTDGAHIIYFGS